MSSFILSIDKDMSDQIMSDQIMSDHVRPCHIRFRLFHLRQNKANSVFTKRKRGLFCDLFRIHLSIDMITKVKARVEVGSECFAFAFAGTACPPVPSIDR